jgi:hypothetical protein
VSTCAGEKPDVELGGAGQSDCSGADGEGELLLGHAVPLLEAEGRAGDVGEHPGHGEAGDDHQARERPVAQQLQVHPQGADDARGSCRW